MNEQNLRPPFNPEEARYYGKKGGEASVKARREKKTIAQKTKKMLYSPMVNESRIAAIEEAGIKLPKNPTAVDILIASAILKEANRGDISKLKEIAEFIGEKTENNNENITIVNDIPRSGNGTNKTD